MKKTTEIQLSMLFGRENNEGLTIEIHDPESSHLMVKIALTPEQVTSLFSRLCMLRVPASLGPLDKWGRKMEIMTLEIPFPKYSEVSYTRRDIVAANLVTKHIQQNPELKGWEPDLFFRSQNSFFRRDEEWFVRDTLRRWV